MDMKPVKGKVEWEVYNSGVSVVDNKAGGRSNITRLNIRAATGNITDVHDRIFTRIASQVGEAAFNVKAGCTTS